MFLHLYYEQPWKIWSATNSDLLTYEKCIYQPHFIIPGLWKRKRQKI